MDMGRIQDVLGRMPELVDSEEDAPQDLLSVAARFTTVLRRLGTEQIRNNSQLSSVVREAVEQMEAIRRAAMEERDRAVLAERRNEAFARIVMGQIDLLDRMCGLMRRNGGLDEWVRQMQNGVRILLGDAAKAGLTETAQPGDPFDPSFHDPAADTDDHAGPGRLVIARVVERGFQLDGRILRRATVETVLPGTAGGE